MKIYKFAQFLIFSIPICFAVHGRASDFSIKDINPRSFNATIEKLEKKGWDLQPMGVAGFKNGDQRIYVMFSPTGLGQIYNSYVIPKGQAKLPFNRNKLYGIEQFTPLLTKKGWKEAEKFAWLVNDKHVDLIVEKNTSGDSIAFIILNGELITTAE